MVGDPYRVAALPSHRDFVAAAPTPDHFIPLLYLAGLADASGRATEALVDGYVYGSLSMTSYGLDVPSVPPAAVSPAASSPAGGEDERRSGDDAAPIPDPAVVPADDTNL
jgi:4,5-DOPA dioxygenase extradiol